jgi:hypothetical protein
VTTCWTWNSSQRRLSRRPATSCSHRPGKEYDAIWRYDILKTLHHWYLRGPLQLIISNFLQIRNFCVQLGNVFSENYLQENGLSQGKNSKCDPFRNFHQLHGKRSTAICGYIPVCGRHCYFIHFLHYSYHRTSTLSALKPLSRRL